ncbi:RNase P subunit p30-domain-containing protein [Zychaea mexicana]|uniref:RNase P subunit p30-domain-containing protein n=1 Tax=Zychaea mexicana TaxID=64656 RepID=UPI0022FF1A2D|nr:RNase P subunit p30-domain-containing protein [Zychaea mexicana]KAI9499683.1 RNase P subunit p30-domain-containing protein [Zychaea mexicana]
MYFDFNIPYLPEVDDKNTDRLRLILARFSQIAESVVALNHVIDHPNKARAIPSIPFEIVQHSVVQLTRVTVETNVTPTQEEIDRLRSKYQLVALRTSNEATFEAACRTAHIDIISMDCSKRLPFRLDRGAVQHAIERGLLFELCYGAGTRDNTQRAYVLQLSKELIACTNGDNLIVSSEANSVADIRAPFDVLYLMKAFGLPNDKAKSTTERNGERLIRKLRL